MFRGLRSLRTLNSGNYGLFLAVGKNVGSYTINRSTQGLQLAASAYDSGLRMRIPGVMFT